MSVPDPITTAIADALGAHVAEIVAAKIEPLLAREPESLLDRAGVARLLACSMRHVDALRAQGMPSIRIGIEQERFERDEILRWLRSR